MVGWHLRWPRRGGLGNGRRMKYHVSIPEFLEVLNTDYKVSGKIGGEQIEYIFLGDLVELKAARHLE